MSDQPCQPRFEKMIDRAFVGDLAPDRWRELSAHLAGCDGCRAYHDRLGMIDAAMANGPLSASMRDRVAGQVMEAASGRGPSKRFSLSAVLSYASAVTAVVVVAVMLPFVVGEGEFNERGADSKWAGRPPGIALFCITPPAEEGGRALVDRTVQAVKVGTTPPELPCGLDQELQIAYSTPTHPPLYLTVQGETAGEPHWYAPRSPGAGPMPLEADAIGQALPWSTRLGVHHEAGTVRVVARFYGDPASDDPVYELTADLEVR